MTFCVIGGGAAGVFAAIHAKQEAREKSVLLFEGGKECLTKVKISGGGRCNVTHAAFEPRRLSQNYPRGNQELIGPFHTFGPEETIRWFEKCGVHLKTEEDGRMFPVSDKSQTIIDALLNRADQLGVKRSTQDKVTGVRRANGAFIIETETGTFHADKLLLATGSHPSGHRFAEALGHEIIPPVPSLFTLNTPASPLCALAGVTLKNVKIGIAHARFLQEGALLITHWGLSGPAALKLSAFGARYLAEQNYQVNIWVDWTAGMLRDDLLRHFLEHKSKIQNCRCGMIPQRLLGYLIEKAQIDGRLRPREIKRKELEKFIDLMRHDTYTMEGKTRNKEEFVTCGGVDTKHVHFKTMESKITKGLFFAGEILNIDGITGGFNFQNAWTTGYIAGLHMAKAN